MDAQESVPGYRLSARLGAGRLWRARESATGETVVLRRLEADPAVLEALRLRLSALPTPYALRLRAVLADDAGTVLVLDHAAGGSLAVLQAGRGVLSAGEVVTVGVPMAQALAAAHAEGLVHGALTARSVLLTGDGMPLLAGLGLTGPGGATPADDVRALAELCAALLPPGAPAPLVAAVEAGRAQDPAARPTAAQLAVQLRRACPAAPLEVPGRPGSRAARRASRRRALRGGRRAPRPRPRVLRVGVPLLALVLLAALTGWWSGRTAELEPPRLAPAAAPAPDWRVLLDGLDAARSEAFAAADPAALGAVYAPGSPGLATDAALVGELAAGGRTAHGVRHVLREVRELSRTADSARLRVVDVLGGYTVQAADGVTDAQVPARGARVLVVELARTASGWRLVEVRPAA